LSQETSWRPVHTVSLGLISLTALVTRALLATYNRSANDDHMEVIQMIVAGRRPLVDDCWQCYQPKLYHETVADLIRLFGLTDQIPQLLVAQFTSCAAGVATLALLFAMARMLPASHAVRLTAFGLIALNPRFTGIAAQATNDAFAILFGTAVIYGFWRYLERGSATDLAVTTLALILASLAKFQGVVFFAMVVTLLLTRLLVSARGARRHKAVGLAAMILAYFATTPFLGSYAESYQTKGDAFAANWERGPAPKLFEHTYYRSPGVRSIADGYFTFRIVDLVRQPFVKTGNAVLDTNTPKARYDPRYAEHRTSLWSQLYGRAQFAQFGSNPPRWETREPKVLNTGRALMIVGLVPLAILVAGVLLEARDLVLGVVRRGPKWLAENDRWTLLAFFGGSLLVVAQLAYLMRDYSSMKVIYVFPGLAAILAIFIRGLDTLTTALAGRPRAVHTLLAAHVAVMALYLLDTIWLLGQLGFPA
jgi:hypothetical protein